MFHVKPPPSDAQGLSEAIGATPEQLADLLTFETLLAQESRAFNLVGPSVLGEFWSRHVFDSAQLLGHAPGARVWSDLGAGAGFPGIVLAILLKSRAETHVHLVESNGKRARFLQEVVDTLALPATVHTCRAESFSPAPMCDVVTARACAPLPRLLSYALPFMRTGAEGLFLKGRNAEAELAEARRSWRFEAELLPSHSDSEGRIVRVRKLALAGGLRRSARV